MADIETPRWRCKHKVSGLMKRLEDHANGTIEMTATQLKAADLYLKKTLPDLNRTEVAGDQSAPIKINVGWSE